MGRVVGSLAVVAMALRPVSEAPPGHVPFFAAVALAAAVYGVERVDPAPDPVRETVDY